MRVYLKKGFVFTPGWNDNKDLPEKEQIRITFEFMSGLVIEALMSESADGTLKSVDPKKEWLRKCTKVENLELGDGKAATPMDIVNEATFLPLWLEAKLAYDKESTMGEAAKKK